MNKEEWLLPKKFRFIAMNYPEFEEDLKSLLSSTKQQIVNEIVEKGDKLKQIPAEIPHHNPYLSGYNTAIKDYQNLIKEQ